jgi:flagellar protein FliT
MNSEEVIALYEAVASLTGQMLDAARSSDWDQLTVLESQCARYVETLKHDEPPAAMTRDVREQKVRIIKKILADDREIRQLTQPWMEQLSALINSTSTERKLSQAYGANQSG